MAWRPYWTDRSTVILVTYALGAVASWWRRAGREERWRGRRGSVEVASWWHRGGVEAASWQRRGGIVLAVRNVGIDVKNRRRREGRGVKGVAW